MTLGELTAYRGQSMSNHEIGNRCNSSPRDAKAELGAAIFNNGLDRGVRSVTKLYPPCGRIKQWSDFANEFTRVDYGWQPQRLVGSRRVLLSIQNDIGYHFNDISLLDRAFSLTDFQATQLGYLGDAVLDLLAAEYWLLDDTICEAGQISHMKDVSTTNNLLAIVAVRWRWHQAVTGSAKGTLNGAAKTIAIVDAKRTRKKVSSRWWQKLMIPKGFGDLVESMVGAIYLDAKFDVDKVRPIFDKCIRPVITELLG
ncbi:Dicer-like protein 1 [Mortierella sp. GBA43]|nr:Dicer-like protein 1 [Mortierella sp. GBA43]